MKDIIDHEITAEEFNSYWNELTADEQAEMLAVEAKAKAMQYEWETYVQSIEQDEAPF